MTKRSELGVCGEEIAARYLAGRGYRILFRNYRKPWGELDIIAHTKAKLLVFVEVKTVRETSSRSPTAEMQMTDAKIKKFSRAAQLFAGENDQLIHGRRGFRLDTLAVTLPADALRRTTEELMPIAKISHYENI